MFTFKKIQRKKYPAARSPVVQLKAPRAHAATRPQDRCSARSAARITVLLLALISDVSAVFGLEPAELVRGFPRAPLVLSTAASGCILIDAYVAQSQQQRAQGLMYVTSMDSHEGMLFLYPTARVISMWMKNTNIPLDMVFADARGTVVHLHAGAVPHDTTIISSVTASALVLELNAGSIDAFGIEPGDQLSLLSSPN